MNKLYRLSMLVVLLLSTTLLAQRYTVSGVVKSAGGENLIGANVFVEGTTSGAATDENGKYEITLAAGRYTVVCSYIGFETVKENINLTNNMVLDFSLRDRAFSLSVEVISERAKERETPVAFSNIEKKEMEQKLGSQDIPMVLNTTPSIYATMSGGGAGDSRINLRGFDQKNVAIMINGVPINDMENGWVYWSNWDGVGDATSSIQIQRGLSAVNLATPSIGGTINIITDPVGFKPSLDIKQEYGSGDFYKTTVSFNTGLIDEKIALNGSLVRKMGNGYIDKTWTDAWAYYFGAAYNINDKNRIELYAIGAPQMHGQNSYKQNAAVYSQEFARELGYSQEALDKFYETPAGRKYNQNWNVIDPNYKGKVAYNSHWFTSNSGLHNRYASDFYNERENFFHKPVVNLNYYSQLTSDVSLYTTIYYSGGTGGGTGTHGASGGVKYDRVNFPSQVVDWNAMLANNYSNRDADGYFISKGVTRNSRNDQWAYGALAKVFYKASENLNLQVGVDWRTARIDHYYELRDLLGGDYYVRYDSDFWGPDGMKLKRGDKFNYSNSNNVDWLGAYLQGEYTANRFTAVATAGWSMVKYTHENFFSEDPVTGKPLLLEPDNSNGFQFKGGLNYRITSDIDIYVNGGYVVKVPIFDQIINDDNSLIYSDPKNENFMNVELGSNFRGLDGQLAVSANIYYTKWIDRFSSVRFTQASGTEAFANLLGLDQTHMGVEIDAAYQPIDLFKLDATISIGMWEYSSDAVGSVVTYDGEQTEVIDAYIALDGIKVGDQPQQSVVVTASFFPIEGLYISGIVKHYREFYAAFDPSSRQVTDPTKIDRAQSWQCPDYTVIDLHAAYDLPWTLGNTRFQIFGHVFNLLDEIYIADAVDNSGYNAFTGNGRTHSADDAEVYLGLPLTFNAGIKISF